MAFNQTKAFFVDSTYILKYYVGYLDPNIDPNSMDTFILLAQAEETQQLLGYTMYTFYVNAIQDYIQNATPIPADYKYLLDNYIVDSVALHAIYYSLNSLHYRATNKAVVIKNSQYSQAAPPSGLNALKNDVLQRAQFADQRVREYIMNYPYNFPLYYQTTGVARLYPKTNTYFGGLYLPQTPSTSRSFPCCGGQGMGLGISLNF
jgi:hypothetical protein